MRYQSSPGFVSKPKPNALLVAVFGLAMSLMIGGSAWSFDGKPWPHPLIDDANLNDVAWIDEQVAWAVGDRGAVFRSADGGASWKMVPVNVDCSLHAVFFADGQRGWIAGGSVDPMATTSTGVVLRTSDGGATWNRVKLSSLPHFHYLGVSAEDQLLAIGDPLALFPSGAFVSGDAGRSWQTQSLNGLQPARELLNVLGHVAGRSTRPVNVDSQRMNVVAGDRLSYLVPTEGPRSFGLTAAGRVLVSDDLGRSWQSAALPAGIGSYLRFEAAAALGDTLWLAGSPGTTVLKSPDSGRTWHVTRTGQSLPIHAIAFRDQLHGVAVGALGTVLTTADGGSSWQIRKGQGNRLGLLSVVRSPEQFVPELFSHATAIGVRSAAVLLPALPVSRSAGTSDLQAARRRLTSNLGPTAAQRLHAALTMSGSAGVASKLSGNNSTELLIRLSLAIRTWRPDVVAVDGDLTDANTAKRLQLVQAAVTRAADQRPTDESTIVDLPPWSCQLASLRRDHRGPGMAVSTDQPIAGLRTSVGGLAHRALAAANNDHPPADVQLQIVSGNSAGRTLASFIERTGVHGQAMRSLVSESGGVSSHNSGRRKIVTALVNRATQGSDSGSLTQLGPLIGQLPLRDGSLILFSAARRFLAAGNVEASLDSLQLLRERNPTSRLAATALVERFLLVSSREFAHHVGRDGNSETADEKVREQRVANGGPAPPPFQPRRSFQPRKTRAIPVSGMQLMPTETAISEDAWDPASLLSQLTPLAQAEPAVRFAVEAGDRRGRKPNDNRRTYQRLGRSMPTPPARRLALAELWLHGDRAGRCPVPLVKLPHADAKPLLDGELDESIWQLAQPVDLGSSAGLGGEALFVRDEDFLYVGLRCEAEMGSDSPTEEEDRERDSDLTSQDRIEIHLDVDRDFVTSWELTIDQRGWANDACCGDPSWNPRLFIAKSRSEGMWIVEAAIALEDLGHTAGAAEWALRISRHLPGQGVDQWPSAVQPGAVWALLVETNSSGPDRRD